MEVSQNDGHGITEISEKLEKSLSLDTDVKMEAYQRYIKDGKDASRQGNISKALELFKLAHKSFPNEKVKSRIKKLEEILAQQDSESEDDEFVDVNKSGLMLYKKLCDNLYDHQRDGVAFLYSLYRDGRKGGILADDMGLGKTIQVISFLSGMYDAELVKCALLVMPTSLITNWTKEFAKWTPGMRVKEFHGTSKAQRNGNLEKIQRRGGVVITTYQMLINNWQQLASHNGQEFTWDYVILDEAHKIKSSSTKTAKSAAAIPSNNRVLLTGTPVQNNLREMWALFDFACQGALLGTSKTFKTEYENPITRAREKDATPGEKALGLKMSENLIATINPYFLRRTKADVQMKKEAPNHPKGAGAEMPDLTRKNDLIVWTYLSPVQEDFYQQFISLDHIKELLMTTKSPLAELNVLKKLCDHPRLLSQAAIAHLGLDEKASTDLQDEENEPAKNSIANVPDETLVSESGKLVFLIALLERLREEGHRVLVFAHFRMILDILERVLNNRGFKTVRLDGTITQLAEREKRISRFQADKRYSVFLLTTQVGGVGITLTAADRVVIFDPSWNPATDAQAVDRAYRIGQTQNVVIYRLITCGTVEEKIYRRQVFKDSLIRQTTGDKKNPFRYFSKQELKELFTVEDTRSSSTQLQLQSLHSRNRRTDPELDEHIAYLHTMEMFGISDHDLMFSMDVNHNEDDPEDQQSHQYIEQRVQKAQELMKMESELKMQLADSMASSTEPAWLRQPAQDNSVRSNEKRQKKEKPSPHFHNHDDKFNKSLELVDLTQTGAGDFGGSPVGKLIEEAPSDVEAADESVQEVMETSFAAVGDTSLEYGTSAVEKSPKNGKPSPSFHSHDKLNTSPELVDLTQTGSGDFSGSPVGKLIEEAPSDVEAADESVQEVMETSFAAVGDTSLEYGTSAIEKSPKNGKPSPSFHNHDKLNTSPELVDLTQTGSGDFSGSPVGKSFEEAQSDIVAADESVQEVIEGPQHSELDSLNGNFNLQLEDSETSMFQEDEIITEQETHAQESQLLSKLQMEGSFNVDKILSVKSIGQCVQSDASCVTEQDVSEVYSFITTKKKRAAVIYDSEEEEEENDNRPSAMANELDDCFKELGAASTPKSVRSGPSKARKSSGGNTSVASRRSLVMSMIENFEDVEGSVSENMENEHSEDIKDASEGTENDNSEDMTNVSSRDGSSLEEEEPSGETLNTENEEEESAHDSSESASSASEMESGDRADSVLEESTTDAELASSERMDQCTVNNTDPDQVKDVTSSNLLSATEVGSYESLVKRGKQCYGEGKLGDALDLFLKAIDISSGDPEIQLMTIQLYRQLSQRTNN